MLVCLWHTSCSLCSMIYTIQDVLKFCHFDRDTRCWIWDGHLNPDGYGRVSKGRKWHRLVHRVVYELLKGPIPDGYVCHHTCQRLDCCRPEHLQLVTRSEHQRLHRLKSHCKRGHARTPDNVYANQACKQCAHDYYIKRKLQRKDTVSV